MKLGSRPALIRICAIIAVVVVLPCVPATATPSAPCISQPRNWARLVTGIAALLRGDQFRIVGANRRRNHHHVDGSYILGAMADEHLDAVLAQAQRVTSDSA